MYVFEPGGAGLDNIVSIPSQRPWRDVNELCPTFQEGECPRDKLVDVTRAVDEAVDIVATLAKDNVRVPPLVISRVYRGGKTTLLELISKKLRESE